MTHSLRDYERMLLELLDLEAGLSDWEMNFCDNVSKQMPEIWSDKLKRKLEEVWNARIGDTEH